MPSCLSTAASTWRTLMGLAISSPASRTSRVTAAPTSSVPTRLGLYGFGRDNEPGSTGDDLVERAQLRHVLGILLRPATRERLLALDGRQRRGHQLRELAQHVLIFHVEAHDPAR